MFDNYIYKKKIKILLILILQKLNIMVDKSTKVKLMKLSDYEIGETLGTGKK